MYTFHPRLLIKPPPFSAILKQQDSGTSTWYNEFGSALTFRVMENGQCSGILAIKDSLHTGEKPTGKVREYLFAGRYDTMGTVIGWSVSWENEHQNDHMVTTWSGQFQWDESINDWVILATWLFT